MRSRRRLARACACGAPATASARGAAVALALLVAAGAGACSAPAAPRPPPMPAPGVSLALYAGERSFAVVDERRVVEVAGGRMLLPNIDPGAALASLVIEPRDRALAIGACRRARIFERAAERTGQAAPVGTQARDDAPDALGFAPVVECEVTGAPGAHLVRIVYVSSSLTYRGHHDIEVRAGRARVTSRFAIDTPPWRTRANVVLYDGTPGGERPARELVRGTITLDGGTSVLAEPPREVTARLRRIYRGTVGRDDAESRDVPWAQDAAAAVWATLELSDVELAPGPVRVHVTEGADERWLEIPAARREPSRRAQPLRLPLWVDDTLRGTRQTRVVEDTGTYVVEVVELGVSNVGSVTREVWIEERLRPARRRVVERAWPVRPVSADDVVRNKVVVRPGRTERVGYTVVYEM